MDRTQARSGPDGPKSHRTACPAYSPSRNASATGSSNSMGSRSPGSEGWVGGQPVCSPPRPLPPDWCWHHPESTGQASCHPPPRGLYRLCSHFSDVHSPRACT
ncbi:hypothetical protein PIB30_029353 [Stylosanthes scabra]|uniref:Uncharacterized protein n=1 Tax=Stylosanthes scabra TaxID=79078 RepID=A0ABU6SC16_9FABA|nr:hypothetical protein [Stylosanthes scabra]